MYKRKQHKFSSKMRYLTIYACLSLTVSGLIAKKDKENIAAIALKTENTISEEDESENRKLLVEKWNGLSPEPNALGVMKELTFNLEEKEEDTDNIEETKEEKKETEKEKGKDSDSENTNEEEFTTIDNKNSNEEESQNQDIQEEYAEAEVQETVQLIDSDYETLVRIVEAEATGEDIKGKILVANVILNRVNNNNFPDSVIDVVFETCGGSPQFSPTADGRFESVEITEESKEAVKLALEGEDYSQGALYFSARSQADPENMNWFDRNLKWLFKYGGHEFYALKD